MSLRMVAALALAGAAAGALGAAPASAAQATRPSPPTRRSSPPAPPAAGPATTAPSPADRDARAGRTALESGDAAKALALVDPVLGREPGHPLAAAVKVDALLGLGERTRALDAYEAWFKVVHAEDLGLLNHIALAELDALQGDPMLQVDALAALSAQPGPRGARARATLTEFATATPPSTRTWPAIVALCRLGDATAARRAVQAYRESTGSGRVTALEAVIAAGPTTAEPVLREALAARDAMLQSTAADGVARLELKSLIPQLREVAANGEMFAKFTAAVALAQLGATGGEAIVDAAATSPAMDARFKAAMARKARGDKGWVTAVRPLLDSEDVGVRYQAAAALLSVDRAAATKVLQAATTDPNPAVRTMVADILTNDPQTPVAELRRLLRDGVPRVRLSAAAALLRRPGPPR